MRSDLKIGMVLGILLVVGVLIVVVYRGQQPSEPEAVPITMPDDVTPPMAEPEPEDEVAAEPEPAPEIVEELEPPTPAPPLPQPELPPVEPEAEDIAETVDAQPNVDGLTIPAIKPEPPTPPATMTVPEPPLPFAPEPELPDAPTDRLDLPEAPEPEVGYAPEPQPTPTAALPRALVHVVQKGDTLYGLSQRYYGSGKYWREILRVNEEVIDNPDTLKVGWELTIPPKQDVTGN